eukprot:2813192-Amphidinium_carterae.1
MAAGAQDSFERGCKKSWERARNSDTKATCSDSEYDMHVHPSVSPEMPVPQACSILPQTCRSKCERWKMRVHGTAGLAQLDDSTSSVQHVRCHILFMPLCRLTFGMASECFGAAWATLLHDCFEI